MPDPKHLGASGYIPLSRRLCIANNVDADYLNLEISKNFESWYSPFFADFKTDINDCECEQEFDHINPSTLYSKFTYVGEGNNPTNFETQERYMDYQQGKIVGKEKW